MCKHVPQNIFPHNNDQGLLAWDLGRNLRCLNAWLEQGSGKGYGKGCTGRDKMLNSKHLFDQFAGKMPVGCILWVPVAKEILHLQNHCPPLAWTCRGYEMRKLHYIIILSFSNGLKNMCATDVWKMSSMYKDQTHKTTSECNFHYMIVYSFEPT